MKNLVTRYSSLVTDKGFTLIELAIVLVIMGLLVGMGAGLVGPLTKRAKVYETKEIMNAAVESVVSFGASSNSLPDAAEFTSTVRTPNDTWTRPLNYIFDSNLTGGICGRRSTNITVNICPDAGCSSPQAINDVAFIILSSGENYNNQTEGDPTATTINVYTQGVDIDNYATDMSRTEPYDDIVKWITLGELRIKTGCVGPQIKILNNELPSGKDGSPYSADVYADSGVPFADSSSDTDSQPDYEWCWLPDPDPLKNPPAGITFTCDISLGSLSSSSTCGLTTGTWQRCTSLSLGGPPSAPNNYKLTFFTRDNSDPSGTNDNIAQKTIVLTINNL